MISLVVGCTSIRDYGLRHAMMNDDISVPRDRWGNLFGQQLTALYLATINSLSTQKTM